MNYKNDNFFITLAERVAKRTTCLRRSVGAVIVKDGEILSMGVNGAPDNFEACESCYRIDNNIPSGEKADHCYALHGEPQAIMNALKEGFDLTSSTIYQSATPCIRCAILIIHSGIKRIVAFDFYPDNFALEMLKKAGIKVEILKDTIELDDSAEKLIDDFLKPRDYKLVRSKQEV